MDNLEQMRAIAQQCSHFDPINKNALNSKAVREDGIDCTMCTHYDEGKCTIKDEILTSMDQT